MRALEVGRVLGIGGLSKGRMERRKTEDRNAHDGVLLRL